jgi:hypothetical protein
MTLSSLGPTFAQNPSGVYSPGRGSPERLALMGVLRTKVKDVAGLNTSVVFKVDTLNVLYAWAFVFAFASRGQWSCAGEVPGMA